MTDVVTLTVAGEQMDIGEDARTELITTGSYYFRNGKHFVIYDETQPDDDGKTTSTIKISEKHVELIRRGTNQAHMVFESGKQHITGYVTSAGTMVMDMFTESVEVTETEDLIEADILYTLSMNEMYVSRCHVLIRLEARISKGMEV